MKIVISEAGSLEHALKVLANEGATVKREARRRAAFVGPGEAARQKSRQAQRRASQRRKPVRRSPAEQAWLAKHPVVPKVQLSSYTRADLIANGILMPVRKAA